MRRRLATLAVSVVSTALFPAPVSAADSVVVAGPGATATSYATPATVVDTAGSLTFLNTDVAIHDVVQDVAADGVSGPSDQPWCPLFADGACPLFWSEAITVAQRTTPVLGIPNLEPGGTYTFYCRFHPSMKGTLSVLPDTSAPTQAQAPKVVPVPVAVFDQPVAMASAPGDPALYVVEKSGRVRALRDGVVDPEPVLDLSEQVSAGLEQGLLGLAFSPDGSRMYVDFTDTAGDTHVSEFAFAGGVAAPATRRDLIFVDQPFANHNGGTLTIGPDGYLYIGLGDGGDAGDPFGNGQNLGTLLGKILRIDPTPSGGAAYTIPPDNPFVDTPGARGEIWAYGLRNPWKYSFDRATGDLWIADVGQGNWEEINFRSAASVGGENYGWDRLEGTHPFEGESPAEHVLPVYEYDHAPPRCSVTGGYVYRGSADQTLAGAYLFSDWCEGSLRALRLVDGEAVVEDLGAVVPSITSFGEDASGELYALSLAGPMFRLQPTGL
jgi:glucose/arabinose dehydrogenase